MGTNFYKVIPVSKKVKDTLKEKIDEGKFTIDEYGNVSIDDVYELNLQPNEIHIGKRSGGWKFLFDFNNWKYFHKSEKSLLDWIYDTSDGSIIKDEYGDTYTPEQFMKEEVDPTYELNEDGSERLDGTSYYIQESKAGRTSLLPKEPTDLYIGKYRVSTFTDFS